MKMKLGIVTPWNLTCGIGLVSEYLTQALLKHDITPTILCDKNPPSNFARRSVEYDSKIDVVPCWDRSLGYNDLGNERHFKELYDEIINREINVVHFQHEYQFTLSAQGFIALLRTLEKYDVKMLVNMHTIVSRGWISKLGGGPTTINRFLGQHMSKIIVHNQIQREELVHSISDAQQKIKIIPLGLHKIENYDKYELRKKLKIKSKHILAIYGFIAEHKGILEVIEAINKLKEKYSDIHLILVGKVPHPIVVDLYREILKRIDTHGLKKNVTVISDFREEEDIQKVIQAADVMLLLYKERYDVAYASAAVKQAFATSRPVIGTNIRCFAEFKDQDSEDTQMFKVQVDDINDYVAGIDRVLSDGNLYKKLEDGSKTIIEQCDYNVLVNEYIDIYRRLL